MILQLNDMLVSNESDGVFHELFISWIASVDDDCVS